METQKIFAEPEPVHANRVDWVPEMRPFVTPVVLQYVLAAAMVVAATMIAVGFDRHIAIPNLSLIYVVPVIVSAVLFGVGPSLFSSVLGALAYNFFFTEPRLTLQVDDPANIWAIGLLFCVGCIASAVASTARRRADHVLDMERQQTTLRHYGEKVRAAVSPNDAVAVTADVLRALFGCTATVVLFRHGQAVQREVRGDAALTAVELEAAATSVASNELVRGDTYPFDGSRFDFWPAAADGTDIAIGVAFPAGARPTAPDTIVGIVAALLGLAISRLRQQSEG